jgi:hypothetical protein
MYREIIAACSDVRTKHINTLCGQSVEFVDVKTWRYVKYALGFEELFSKSPYSVAVLFPLQMIP